MINGILITNQKKMSMAFRATHKRINWDFDIIMGSDRCLHHRTSSLIWFFAYINRVRIRKNHRINTKTPVFGTSATADSAENFNFCHFFFLISVNDVSFVLLSLWFLYSFDAKQRQINHRPCAFFRLYFCNFSQKWQ